MPCIPERRWFLPRFVALVAASLFLFVAHSASAQLNLQITTATLPDGATFKLLDRVPWAATIQPVSGAFDGPGFFLAYVTGQDVYGNRIYIEVGRGNIPAINQGGTFQIREQFWQIPNDGTLFNIDQPGLQFVISLFTTAPTTLPQITTAAASPLLTRTGRFFIEVIPDLAVAAPGVTYRPGDYRGGDVVRFETSWGNRAVGEPNLQSRPLRARDGYSVGLRLTENPAYNIAGGGGDGDGGDGGLDDDDEAAATDDVNDDFKLMAIIFGGDLAGILPDGANQFRSVQVVNTPPGTSGWPDEPGSMNPYGIAGITDGSSNPSERDYTPQPDDGFLDIGEGVTLTSEQLIPRNFEGDYFVAMRLSTSSDASEGNNIFVSNAANKITIDPTNDPKLEPASAVSTQDGQFVQGGNAGSADGGISDTGTIVFASRASNLLVPPAQAGATVPPQFATSGNQIFLKLSDTREVFLASRTAAGVPANADCFDPFISADGRYVAFHSAATNLVEENTGGRSMIYVFDTLTRDTVVVSRNALGALANGDSYNAALSASGRFVVFESVASNLAPPVVAAVIGTGQQIGQIRSYTVLNGGAGYQPFSRFDVAVVGGSGSGAQARATVGEDGNVIAVSPIGTNYGGGYSPDDPPTVIVPSPLQLYPEGARQGQVYLHDRNVEGLRDVEGNPIFDEPGNIRTYLVSLADNEFEEWVSISDNLSFQPAINADDSAEALEDNGGMFVAFSSYAGNLPQGSGYAMVYRALVDVGNQAGVVEMEAASVNNANAAGVWEEPGSGVIPFNLQPSISGDGSQVAFTSWSDNLVYDPVDGDYTGDTNGVQDVFVRNFRIPVVGPQAANDSGATVRVSVSEEKVATGTIFFVAAPPPTPTPGYIPDGQPAVGDSITLSDGVTTHTFVFGPAPAPPSQIAVPIGSSVFETRNNLRTAIATASPRLKIDTFITTPPASATPGTAYRTGLYLRNQVRGVEGNTPILVNGLPIGLNGTIAGSGMAGAGTQAVDNPAAVQGVPFGSNQPSIDRSGRYVAFRTIAGNLDVYQSNASRTFTDPADPITGELIRPLLTPGSAASNIYFHDRNAQDLRDDDGLPVFDLPFDPDSGEEAFTTTRRVSVSRFGYPTYVGGTQEGGVNANTSANSSRPFVSPNGRYVVFTSTAIGEGGLVFGPNNLSPLDNTNLPDVFVADLGTLGDAPPLTDSRPSLQILSPPDGLVVAPQTQVPVYVTAFAKGDKALVSAELFVNNASRGILTEEPFVWSYTVPTTGSFVFRVVVTDDKGLSRDAAVLVRSEPAQEGAPLVEILQPTGVRNFAAGSTFFINGRVTATRPAEVIPSSVRFTVNGVPVGGEIGVLGNRYGVLYTATSPNTVANLRVLASDTLNRTGFSPPIASLIADVRTALPEVQVRPVVQASPVTSGSTVQLQAEAQFFGAEPSSPSDSVGREVEFYVNNVFVGRGTIAGPAAGGRTLYVFNWPTPEIIDARPGPAQFTVRARAVEINGGLIDDSSYVSAVSAATPLVVYYVPTDPAPGSNEAFIIDNFETIFFRVPNFEEYQDYLDLFAAGFSQAQIIEAMLKSAEFAEFQQVLFGYYLRMGLQPKDPAQVLNFNNVMRSADGRTLLPAAMSAGLPADATNLPRPYGATRGQAEVASTLLSTPTLMSDGVMVRNLQNQPFRDWALRTFNEPYLPTVLTNPVITQGNQTEMLETIAGPFPQEGATAPQRFGAFYALQSAAYASLIDGKMNPSLKTTFLAFPGLVRGIAFQYLYKGTWNTAASAATPTEIAKNLVPGITSPATVDGRVDVSISYQITTQNAAVTAPYTATGLPPGLVLNAAEGVISGTPTSEGEFQALLSATNDNGTGEKQVTFVIVAPTPVIDDQSFTTFVGEGVEYSIESDPDPAEFVTTYILSGGINQLRLTNPGVGYSSAPEVTITGGGGSGARATAVVGSGPDLGKVTAVTIDNPGIGYTSNPQVTLSGGGGSGARADAYVLPQGLSFNDKSGVISGTPMAGSEGGYELVMRVQNSGGSLSAKLTIEVGEARIGGASDPEDEPEPPLGPVGLSAIAFGSLDSNSSEIPLQVNRGSGELELLWLQLSKEGTHVSYSVWSSEDLVNWTKEDFSLRTNGRVPQMAADQTSVPADYERWRVTLPIEEDRGFYRVEACFENCPVYGGQ